MVEQTQKLNVVFSSLSDPTRRDILQRVSEQSMSVGAIAKYYKISFAGVAKHLEVLERADLIHKTRHGKEQIVTIAPETLAEVTDYLDKYRQLWEQRLDSLDNYLKTNKKKGTNHGSH